MNATAYDSRSSGGGGVRTAIRPTLGTRSFLMPRVLVQPRFEFVDFAQERAA